MKLVIKHLGEIIIALAGIILIICSIIFFKPRISFFFANTLTKMTGISYQVLDKLKDTDLKPEPSKPEMPDNSSSYQWVPTTFNGSNNIIGRFVWTDGTDYYYSRAMLDSDIQLKLNRETNTWEIKTWAGCNSFDGEDVWTDGTDTYLSLYNSKTSKYEHYILRDNKWVTQSWNYTKFTGSNIWNSNTYVFYCNDTVQIAMKNGKWLNAASAFTGLDSFFGSEVWTDGTTFYYSFIDQQYKLNGWAWEPITWNGITNEDMEGNMIWTDGECMYHSLNEQQYKINTETLTLEAVNWTGLERENSGLCGADVWTDGINIYFSAADDHQYIKVKN